MCATNINILVKKHIIMHLTSIALGNLAGIRPRIITNLMSLERDFLSPKSLISMKISSI